MLLLMDYRIGFRDIVDFFSTLISTAPWDRPLFIVAMIAFVCGQVLAVRTGWMRMNAKNRVNQMLPDGQKLRTTITAEVLHEYERHFTDRTTRKRMRHSAALSGAFFAVFMLCLAVAGIGSGISMVAALAFLTFSLACIKGFLF